MQTGRRAIVTGANSGIGFEAALELARRGAEVVLPARSEAKAKDAAARIQRLAPGARLVPEILDLADLGSVRAFAGRYGQRFEGASLDLLINNAGVMAVPQRELTVDGFERQFATNFLGPFALTALLLPRMRRAAGSRIVTLSSGAANGGKIDFANLQGEQSYKPMLGAYAQSKLADLMFALELQRRLTAAAVPIASISCHPGFAVTNLQADHISFGLKVLTVTMKPFFSHDAAHGALPTLYAATAKEAQPGGYYGPDGPLHMKGYPAEVEPPATAKDEMVAKRLWETAERLTGVAFRVV